MRRADGGEVQRRRGLLVQLAQRGRSEGSKHKGLEVQHDEGFKNRTANVAQYVADVKYVARERMKAAIQGTTHKPGVRMGRRAGKFDSMSHAARHC